MPRSANRDRIDRLENRRDYFRHRNPLERWKFALGCIAVGLFAVWAIASFSSRRYYTQASHGPVANVHQTWNAKCEACHEFNQSSGALDAHGKWNTLNSKCVNCHLTDGAPHHANIKAEFQNQSCGSCHHDHNGQDFSLVKMSDLHCTKCHENLKQFAANEPASEDSHSIVGFNRNDHPGFKSVEDFARADDDSKAWGKEKTKPRALKFSHGRHMVAGMRLSKPGTPDKAQMTIGDFNLLAKQIGIEPKNLKERYGKTDYKDSDAVQLECASCHQLDSGLVANAKTAFENSLKDAPTSVLQPPRAAGAEFLPINFDAHCKSCHPTMTAPETQLNEKERADISKALGGNSALVLGTIAIPHRQQAAGLEKYLRGAFSVKLQNPDGVVNVSDRPIDSKSVKDPVIQGFNQAIESVAKKSAQHLLQNACVYCHEVTTAADRKPDGLPEIVPPAIPTVWMEHARFDHTPHRATDCRTCHEKAYAQYDGEKLLRDDRDVIKIAGRDSCIQCHAPKNGDTGGVRHGCTDCHSYHHGDRPLQGRGAPALEPRIKFKPEDFLRGSHDTR